MKRWDITAKIVMKKFYLLSVLIAILISCNENEPQSKDPKNLADYRKEFVGKWDISLSGIVEYSSTYPSESYYQTGTITISADEKSDVSVYMTGLMGYTKGEIMYNTEGKVIVVFDRSSSSAYNGSAVATVTYVPIIYLEGSKLKGDVVYAALVTKNGKTIVGSSKLQLSGNKR